MRKLALLLLAAMAGAQAAPAQAQPKPPVGEEAEDFRSRAYPICLAINPLVARDGSVNDAAIDECWCSIDWLVAQGRSDDVRAVDRSNAQATFGPAIAACRSGEAPSRAERFEKLQRDAQEQVEAARRDADALVAQVERQQEADRPADRDAADAAPSGPAWTSPSWLAWTGLPGWALGVVAVFAALMGLALLLTRRRGGRGDLVAPPPSWRGRPPGRR